MSFALLCIAASAASPKHTYRFDASFVEGCSCKGVCVTEITGQDAGCHGLGAIRFKTGSFDGRDLAKTAAAFAWDSGKWVRIYIDAPAKQRPGVTAFMKTLLADWGKLESVSAAKIEIVSGKKEVALLIDGGKVGALHVKPIFGRDGKTAVVHSNLTSPFHKTLMQGETSGASFTQGHPFDLSATNGFYNLRDVMKGKV